MSSFDETVSWCSVHNCQSNPQSVNDSSIIDQTPDSEYDELGSGGNDSCSATGYPFCVNVLIYTINDST